jgi:hypothetical protein
MLLISKTIIILTLMHHSAPPQEFQTEIVVSFKKVYHLQSFNMRVSWILLDHYCD